VELEDGTQYLADKAVISTIDPHQTFPEVRGGEEPDSNWPEMVKIWAVDSGASSMFHLALAEPPQFKARGLRSPGQPGFHHLIDVRTWPA